MILSSNINDRVKTVARYMIDTKCTVRQAASHFCISKSTVHKDLTCTLPKIDRALWDAVRKILETNKAQRHMRGGEATRLKYLSEKINNSKKLR